MRVVDVGTHAERLAQAASTGCSTGQRVQRQYEIGGSMSVARCEGHWTGGTLPPNVTLGEATVISGDKPFHRFLAQHEGAIRVGASCTLNGVQFAVGKEGQLSIGDYCYFTHVVLLCELELCIGSYVAIGWNTTIADSDFHPIAVDERIADAIACSPLGKHLPRPTVLHRPVIIEDDVWIGPSVVILKGVRIGAGAVIEAGSLITRDVPPRARMLGNPAQIIGEV
jgi:acetyltransferase-like isoleucine patch superfamily enzyme